MSTGRRLAGAAAPPGDRPAAPAVTLRDRQGMSPVLKWLFLALIVVGYALVAVAVAFAVSRSGNYPSGSDTMFYVYRGDFLYKSITQEGNWYPLIDMSWYNGVETWRYWSPLSAYILAGCQAVMGGSPFSGFLLCVGIFYFLSAMSWLIIGVTHDRPWMGAFIGAIWFLIPNNAFMFFSDGVLARSMSMCVLPWFVVGVHDYLYRPWRKKWPILIQLILTFVILVMNHLGWAGMVAISLLIYLLFYFFSNIQKKGRVMVSPLILCMILAILITGVWTLPSLIGGITGLDSSSIMKNYFQSLNVSLNPFYGWSAGGSWNRWDNIMYSSYFGPVAFALAVFGTFLSRKETKPGFATAVTICLLTSTAAYPILSKLPGSQYLWMLRFISIALTFLLVSFFFWRSLKKHLQRIIAVLLVAESVLSFGLFLGNGSGLTPEVRYTAIEESTLIGKGKTMTSQRFSVAEPVVSVPDLVYSVAGFGPDAVNTSFGQGVQAAPQYSNIIQLNQAAQDGYYLYLFDRMLEMGNDTVLFPIRDLAPAARNPAELDAAAAEVGYIVVDATDDYRLYHLKNAPQGHWGVVSKYRAAAIGTGSGSIALSFPATQEFTDPVVDDYTFDQLKDYDVIYLAGFTYNNKETAEKLLLDLSQQGSRIIIMADGIPDEEHTGSKTFLDVACNRVNFQNGYPALDTIDGVLYCDLFPSEYAEDWQTVYVTGLDEVWGTITDVPEGKMDFYGTAKNDNIIFIALGLTYHYSLTKDAAVGALLEHALELSPQELPQREIVPIGLDYHDNVITIDAPRDNVNTTLGWHDIFRADRSIRAENHLTMVDEGRTVIHLDYPYLIPSLAITGVGLLLTVGYLILMRRRFKALARLEAGEAAEAAAEAPAAEAPVGTPAEAEAPGEAPAETPAEAPVETPAEAEAPGEAPAETPTETPAPVIPDVPAPPATEMTFEEAMVGASSWPVSDMSLEEALAPLDED